MTSDAEYYRARALEERDRAATATEPKIVAIHLELATKYESLANDVEVEPTSRPGWEGMSGAQPA